MTQNTDRFKRRVNELETRNRELLEEVKVLEQERALYFERNKKNGTAPGLEYEQTFAKPHSSLVNNRIEYPSTVSIHADHTRAGRRPNDDSSNMLKKSASEPVFKNSLNDSNLLRHDSMGHIKQLPPLSPSKSDLDALQSELKMEIFAEVHD